MNTARVRKETYNPRYAQGARQDYAQSPLINGAPVIHGYFKRENLVKEMAIRKINKSLCYLLGMFIFVAFVSYYFSMSYELKLNSVSRQITTLNDENAELQYDLDKLQSFNNVDSKMLKGNVLRKAANVVEVAEVTTEAPILKKQVKAAPFQWSVGY